jgi:cysteine/O-acetylserine efflux protein
MFNLTGFLIFISVTAYTPGPNNILSMSNAVRYGLKKSFPFNLGIWVGFSIVMLICAALGSIIFSRIAQAKIFMQLLGAAYMLFLAWQTWNNSSIIESGEEQGATFASGATLQFVNPKLYIYAVTSMSTFVLPYFHSAVTLFGFALFLAFFGFVASTTWAIFGSAFRKLLSAQAKIVNPILAVLLIYCAISLFL